MSKKNNNDFDSIGNGLLDDKKKYNNKQKDPQMIEMKQLSKRYDYVSLDDQVQYIPARDNKKQPVHAQNTVIAEKIVEKPKEIHKQIGQDLNSKIKAQNIGNQQIPVQNKQFGYQYQQPYPQQYQSSFMSPVQMPSVYVNVPYLQRSNYVIPVTNTSAIYLNGSYFPNQSYVQPPPVKRSGIPDMLVKCSFCQISQNIEGHNTAFKCYKCAKINQCNPVYNVIICQNCKCKVCYQLGTSSVIRCSKCKEVNQVPVSYEECVRLKQQKKNKQKIAENTQQIEPILKAVNMSVINAEDE